MKMMKNRSRGERTGPHRKMLLEIGLVVVFPFFFTYAMLINEVNSIWSAILVFSGLCHGMTGSIRMVPAGYILGACFASILYQIIHGPAADLIIDSLRVHLVALLASMVSTIRASISERGPARPEKENAGVGRTRRKTRADGPNIVQSRENEAQRLNREIEKRKQAEKASREIEEMVRKLVEAAPVSVGMATIEDGRPREAPDFYGRLLARPAEEEPAKARCDLNLLGPEDMGRFTRILEEEGEVNRFEVHLEDKSGAPLDALIWARPLKWAGRDCILSVMEDVTARKRWEELNRIQRELGAALGPVNDFQEGLRLCLGAAIRASGMDSGGIYLVDRISGAVDLLVAEGLSPAFVKEVSHYNRDSVHARSIMKGHPLYLSHREIAPMFDEAGRGEQLRAMAIAPTIHGGEVIGCMCIASRRLDETPPFSRLALEAISTQIGGALARLRADEELRLERENTAWLIDESPSIICRTTPDGVITFINPAGERITGYSSRELIGRGWRRLLYPGDDSHGGEGLFENVKGGKARDIEATLTTRYGERRTVVWNYLKVYEGGELFEIIGFGSDITARKRAEEELRDSEEKFRNLVEGSVQGIIVHRNFKPIFTNRAMADILGRSREEILDRDSLLTFFPPDEHIRLADGGGARRHGERAPLQYEVQAFGKDHSEIWLYIGSRTVNWQGEPAIQLTAVDITGQKRLENQLQQARKMEVLGVLAGGIAHDFNNIIQVITGYIELARLDVAAAAPIQDALEQIFMASERGKDLVKRILTFSRKSKPVLMPLDLNAEVEKAARLFERTLPKMIHVRMSLAENLKLIKGDDSQLEQVLMNLGTNARDAMPEGGELVIETGVVELDDAFCRNYIEMEPGEYIFLGFSDNGQGMDGETIKKIFDPFFTTKDVGKGTGLGLSTVFGIVKEHGGCVACRSEPGMGAAFTIYFPILVEESASPAAGATAPQEVSGGSETILVVDDEEAIRRSEGKILARQGYETMLADSGEEALSIYRKMGKGIDLVVLDINMPGMGGMKCLEKLVEFDPDVRILVVSGYSPESQLTEAMASGDIRFLPKPFQRVRLLKAVREALDRIG